MGTIPSSTNPADSCSRPQAGARRDRAGITLRRQPGLDYARGPNAAMAGRSVHITQPATASQLAFAAASIAAATYGMDLGAVRVDVQDSTGSLVSSPRSTRQDHRTWQFKQSVTIESNGEADFNLSSVILGATRNYVLTASGTGLTRATATVDVTAATLTSPPRTYSVLTDIGPCIHLRHRRLCERRYAVCGHGRAHSYIWSNRHIGSSHLQH